MREKVLFALFLVAVVVLGGVLYFSHNQAEPVVSLDKGTTIVESANTPNGQTNYVEGKEVALFDGYVTATIYTDLVKTSGGNIYEQSIFVRVYTKGKFDVKIETLGGELLTEFTVGDNDGYNIENAHCISPEPAVIMTVKHGSKVEKARLLSDVIR